MNRALRFFSLHYLPCCTDKGLVVLLAERDRRGINLSLFSLLMNNFLLATCFVQLTFCVVDHQPASLVIALLTYSLLRCNGAMEKSCVMCLKLLVAITAARAPPTITTHPLFILWLNLPASLPHRRNKQSRRVDSDPWWDQDE